MTTKQLKIAISEKAGEVSALLFQPDSMSHLLVLAHGAGAGMIHPFMEQLAHDLSEQGIGTLRFQFPYMEKGGRAPDRPPVATATIQKVIQTATELAEGIPLLAGGKSFGGRMTSTLASQEKITQLKGLVFFGFPLHGIGKPSTDRAAHLQEIDLPMLFLQGTRDKLAEIDLITPVCNDLPLATLKIMEGADHSFKMLKRSGVTQEEMIRRLAETTREWSGEI